MEKEHKAGQLTQTDLQDIYSVTNNVFCLAVKTEGGALEKIPTAQRLSGYWAACRRWEVIAFSSLDLFYFFFLFVAEM